MTEQQEIAEEVLLKDFSKRSSNSATLVVYPNPAIYNMNIDVQGLGEEYTICIFDQIGRQIWKSEKVIDAKHQKLDIREIGVVGGSFQVIIKSKNHFMTKKIVIIG